jgi:hypothetical protein
MLDLIELENGNLKIVVTNKEELQDVIDREQDERDALFDMLERTGFIGNNWGVIYEAGLTEAPAIGYDLSYADDGELDDVEKLWFYNDYMVTSYLEKLKEDGFVIFTAHHINKMCDAVIQYNDSSSLN